MKPILKSKILIRIIALLLTANFFWSISYAQNELNEPEKKQATVQLSFYKNADLSKIVVANVSAKNDSAKLIFVEGVKINFYFLQPSGESFLASAITNGGGKASVRLPKNLPADTSGITFIARLKDDKVYADTEAEGTVKDVRLVLVLSDGDTSKLITARVMEMQTDGNEKLIENVEVSFGIQRLFGIMPLDEEATVPTDDNGVATFAFPKEIKGDEKGKVVLVARIMDHELYGNVEAIAPSAWGAPLVVEKNPFPRALWEPNAPVLLIISFSIIFGGIWLTYGVVVYQISKIERKAPAPEQNQIITT